MFQSHYPDSEDLLLSQPFLVFCLVPISCFWMLCLIVVLVTPPEICKIGKIGIAVAGCPDNGSNHVSASAAFSLRHTRASTLPCPLLAPSTRIDKDRQGSTRIDKDRQLSRHLQTSCSTSVQQCNALSESGQFQTPVLPNLVWFGLLD